MARPTPRPIPVVTARALHTIGVPFHQKEAGKGNWCWAACAQMLLESNGGSPVTQCEIARFLGRGDCCSALPGDPCNQELEDPQITALLISRGVKKVCFQPRELDSAELVRELDAGRPVQVGVTNGSVGHVVLVVGYQDVQPERQFTVHDPDRPVPFPMTYLGLKSVLGTWDASWTLIVR